MIALDKNVIKLAEQILNSYQIQNEYIHRIINR